VSITNLSGKRLRDEANSVKAKDETYDWDVAITLDAQTAFTNAESYTQFAFLMRCADKGYKIQTTDNNNIYQYDVAKSGQLVWDQNLERVGGWNVRGPTP
jgi:hypothetical protein